MMELKSFNLFDLGYDVHSNKIMDIPNIQRGLVWKPRQIELLWDSILRGFPIGTFTIVKSIEEATGAQWELVDGQQRLNAIQAAFDKIEKNSSCIVWFDLDPDKNWALDRKYYVRVTTTAHPWGYHLDGSTLLTQERRDAIDKAGEIIEMRKSERNILNYAPASQVGLPIPLTFLLSIDANDDKRSKLLDLCVELSKKAPAWKEKYLQKLEEIDDTKLNDLWGKLDSLRQYEVSSTILSGHEDLEILFERIGTGGTPISRKELAYATMKFYWNSKDFSHVNHDIAKTILPEADFAMIVFRACLSGPNNIKDEFSVKEIRDIYNNKPLLKSRIDTIYSNDGAIIRGAVASVDHWLLSSGFPPVIRTEIARNYSKLYVFLIWLALKQNEEKFDLEDNFIRALACYLYVCHNQYSIRNKEKYRLFLIEYLYKNLQNKSESIQQTITDSLNEMVALGWCMAPAPSLEAFPALNAQNISENWKYCDYSQELFYGYFERLFERNPQSHFVLRLFQKEYYQLHFGDYDPSRNDLWADTNRPWDHDHIVPWNWSEQDGVWKPVVKQLIDSIGNIADIPYELNRSKSDNEDWTHYETGNNPVLLLGKEELLSGLKSISKATLVTDKETVSRLLYFVRERFLAITSSFNNLLSVLNIGKECPPTLKKRHDFLIHLQETALKGFKFYFVKEEEEQEFDPKDNISWLHDWITLGGEHSDHLFMPAVTVGIYSKDCSPQYIVEYGLRKRPDLKLSDIKPSPTWWKPDYYNKIQIDDPQRDEKIIEFLSQDLSLD